MPVRIRCGTAAAPVCWHRFGTGAAPVRNRCGTGAEPVRHRCGSRAERRRTAGGPPAERRRNAGGSAARRPLTHTCSSHEQFTAISAIIPSKCPSQNPLGFASDAIYLNVAKRTFREQFFVFVVGDDDDELVANPPTPCKIGKHPPAPEKSGRPAKSARWRAQVSIFVVLGVETVTSRLFVLLEYCTRKPIREDNSQRPQGNEQPAS